MSSHFKSIDRVKGIKSLNGKFKQVEDYVVKEVLFKIIVNNVFSTSIMIIPEMIYELSLGFCISEGFIKDIDELNFIEIKEENEDFISKIWTANIGVKKSSFFSTGLYCPPKKDKKYSSKHVKLTKVDSSIFFDFVDSMTKAQFIYLTTGGTHAALLGTYQGKVLKVCEDIGRHNALDKVIGFGMLNKINLKKCLVYLSGRISYEIALKVIRAGFPLVGSVSAPTNLSIKLLKKAGVTLISFTRFPRFTIYTHPERVR